MSEWNSHDAFEGTCFNALSREPVASAEAAQLTSWDHHPTLNIEPYGHPTTYCSSPSESCPTTPAIPPKCGGRFSNSAVRVLRAWFNAHEDSPYPNPEDLQFLKVQTGLDHKQITNWFANARRRGRIHGVRSGSVQISDKPKDLASTITRPLTPAVRSRAQHKHALQRWVHSPPENEPAAVSDIARAVAIDSDCFFRCHSRDSSEFTSNDHPGNICFSSSASSTTQSDCYSSGSQKSYTRTLRKNKRRLNTHRQLKKPAISADLPYQCTFCTETFKTKHDWQRHERVLHLTLEQWVCAPEGPRVPLADDSEIIRCVFCLKLSPDDNHIEAHQYSACQMRDLRERTFNRKDHLIQHLRLVHKADCGNLAVDRWKTSSQNVTSRCGFCMLIMGTWTERIDHLADHFKAGATMSEWKGDWGFEDTILRLVENGMPPYLIHSDRSTPFPMRASNPPTATPVNAYELLKLEIDFYQQNWLEQYGQLPSSRCVHIEACRIIFASEALVDEGSFVTPQGHGVSWLRDLVMSSLDVSEEARFGPIRCVADGVSTLRINGQDQLFERCQLEAQLRAFVGAENSGRMGLSDWELQREACEIIHRIEKDSKSPLDGFAGWVISQIEASSEWLLLFKLRAGIFNESQAALDPEMQLEPVPLVLESALLPPDLPVLEPVEIQHPMNVLHGSRFNSIHPADVTLTHPIINNTFRCNHSAIDSNFYRMLVSGLRRWALATMSPTNPNCHVPSDEEIQHHARWIIYESDDPWNQTAADNPEWLREFKRNVGIIQDADGTEVTGVCNLW